MHRIARILLVSGILFVALIVVAVPTRPVASQNPGCTPPPANMVSWWPGEGNANDIVDGNNGVLQGGATFAPGVVGQAFQLNGGGAFVDLGNASNLHVSAGDFTVDAWVNLAALPPGYDMSIVDKMQRVSTLDDEDGWRLLRQSDNHFWFCFGGGAGNNGCGAGYPTTVRSTTVATTGVWYHVAGVKSSSTITLYVNGGLEDSKPLAPFTDTNTTNLVIGSLRSSTIGPDAYFNGLVDEVEIYNRALSGSEIQAIVGAGSAGKCQQAPNTPPNCSAAGPSVATLWPPNHQFVPVNVLGVTDPDGDPVTITITSIFQDEPVNGTGEGDTSPDGQGVGSSTAAVRAERAGSGNGRVYHIGFTANDGQGGTCSGEVRVAVPKSQGKKGEAVDDGPQVDSTIP